MYVSMCRIERRDGDHAHGSQRAASVVALGLWLRRDDPLQCARGIRRRRRPWISIVGGVPQGHGRAYVPGLTSGRSVTESRRVPRLPVTAHQRTSGGGHYFYIYFTRLPFPRTEEGCHVAATSSHVATVGRVAYAPVSVAVAASPHCAAAIRDSSLEWHYRDCRSSSSAWPCHIQHPRRSEAQGVSAMAARHTAA